MKNRSFPTPGRLYWSARTAAYAARDHKASYLDPERLQALQDRRARRLLAHAVRSVPFYRDHFSENRLSLADFRGADDFKELPLISGKDLSKHPERFRSDRYSDKDLLTLETSGSSGHSKAIYWDKAAVFRTHAAGLRQRQVLAHFVGHLSRYRSAAMSRPGGSGTEVRAFHRQHAWVPDRTDPARLRISPSETFEATLQQINEHQPDVIGGFGSCVGALFRRAWMDQREIHQPKLISYGGDHMPAIDQRLIREQYDIPVITAYQACEALRIAQQCEQAGGLHILADHCHLRVVDEHGHSLPAGQTGRIVISSLLNRATVLLNYDIGDRGSLASSPCPCGRTLPMLERLDGRTDDVILLPSGEMAHESVVLSGLYGVSGVMRVQVVQEGARHCTARIVIRKGVDWNATVTALQQAFEHATNHESLQVDWQRADELRPEASGKFRSIISRIS